MNNYEFLHIKTRKLFLCSAVFNPISKIQINASLQLLYSLYICMKFRQTYFVTTQRPLFLYPFDFQFDFVELKIKRKGIVSLSPGCASLTGGYAYLPAAGRFSPVGAKSLNT